MGRRDTVPCESCRGSPGQDRLCCIRSEGMLNFIDVTDLGVPKVLARLAANPDEGRIWDDSFSYIFREPGKHTVLLRFVPVQPGGAGDLLVHGQAVHHRRFSMRRIPAGREWRKAVQDSENG